MNLETWFHSLSAGSSASGGYTVETKAPARLAAAGHRWTGLLARMPGNKERRPERYAYEVDANGNLNCSEYLPPWLEDRILRSPGGGEVDRVGPNDDRWQWRGRVVG